jgi:hypothetical protein
VLIRVKTLRFALSHTALRLWRRIIASESYHSWHKEVVIAIDSYRSGNIFAVIAFKSFWFNYKAKAIMCNTIIFFVVTLLTYDYNPTL